jgi:hypothetical protein
VTVNLGDGKPLVVRQNGGNLTGFAGLPLVGKVEKIFGLISGATERLKDTRTQALIDHNRFAELMGRVGQIVCGLADANDADIIKADAALKKLLGRDPEDGLDGPSQPSYCRFENSQDEKVLEKLFEYLIDYYIRTHRKAPRRILLYCDGSAVETYGNQQGSVYRGGKYKKEMYFPFFIFDHTGWLIAAVLRPGDNGESPSGVPILKKVIEKLNAAWPHTRIGVRADAAFASHKLFDFCEDNGIDYVVGIAGNHALAVLCYDHHCQAKKRFVRKYGQPEFTGGRKGKQKKQKFHAKIKRMPKERRHEALAAWKKRRTRVYGEVSYKARPYRQDRKVICRSDYTDDGLHTRYVVTNIEWGYPEQIYEQEYCPHANVELSIKEFKNSMLLRLSCEEFNANAFRVYLHGLAYQLLYHLRGFLPLRFKRVSLETVRKLFINVVAQVECSSRRVYWGLSETYAHVAAFMHLCRRLETAG